MLVFYYARNQTRKNGDIKIILILIFHMEKAHVDLFRKYGKFPVKHFVKSVFSIVFSQLN